jgi:hypothetical protein
MTREIGREPAEIAPDRPSEAGKRPQRFRLRIRDWLVAVLLMALLAAGVSQIVRERRLAVERELAEALRVREAVRREREALMRKLIEEEARKRVEERLKQIDSTPKNRQGDFPDLDRQGPPNDGRTVP